MLVVCRTTNRPCPVFSASFPQSFSILPATGESPALLLGLTPPEIGNDKSYLGCIHTIAVSKCVQNHVILHTYTQHAIMLVALAVPVIVNSLVMGPRLQQADACFFHVKKHKTNAKLDAEKRSMPTSGPFIHCGVIHPCPILEWYPILRYGRVSGLKHLRKLCIVTLLWLFL